MATVIDRKSLKAATGGQYSTSRRDSAPSYGTEAGLSRGPGGTSMSTRSAPRRRRP